MSNENKHLREIGKFRLDAEKKVLSFENKPIDLPLKEIELLCVLTEKDGELVTKEALLNRVWKDSFVEESNLTRHIYRLRKMFEDYGESAEIIQNVPRRGYRFTGNIVHKVFEQNNDEFIVERHHKQQFIIKEIIEKQRQIASSAKLQTNRKNNVFLAASVGVLVVGILGFLGFGYLNQSTKSPSFIKTELKQVTTNGNAVVATISPDRKYIVHVKETSGKQTLLVRQTEETKDIEVVSPQTAQFWGITVSPDSKRIFYTIWESNKSDAALFQVPILGGTPQKVLDIIDSAVSFSPDGNKIAYFRWRFGADKSDLVTANIDGTDINILATRNSPDAFDSDHGSPAWSPDGKTILAVGSSTKLGEKCQILAVDAITGTQTSLTDKSWTIIDQVAWLPSQNGFVMNAGETFGAKQIWYLSYPSGEARKITNNLNDYVGVKTSADGKTLVTVQREQLTHHSIAPSSDIMNGTTILSETGKNASNEGVSWTSDGKLILRYSQNNQDNIWQIDADGENKYQLTLNSNDINPTVSADGRTIVFSSKEDGIYRLWRMDKNGENRKLLTNEGSESELFPHCSTVENVCVYQRGWKKSSIYKVSLETGEISSLSPKGQASRPAFSPDGKFVAYFGLDSNDVWFLSIVSLDKSEVLAKFSIAETVITHYVRWSPDGKNLAYIDQKDKVSNIFFQPVNGEKSFQITDFKSEEIFYFDWSRDGKSIAYSHGTSINNVISINDFE
jgi:Tol biopolymer transport system component/DNA-binding winged helix-turn-helix (wHTH) protein